MKLLRHKEDNKGQAALVSVLLISALLITITATMGTVAINEYRLSSNDILSSQVRYLAESGIQNALLQIGEGTSYTGGTFSSDINSTISATDTVSVTYNNTVSPPQATIISSADATYSGSTKIIVSKSIQVVAELSSNPAIYSYDTFANNNINAEYFTQNGDMQANNLLYLQYGSITASNINAIGNGGGDLNYLNSMNINNTGGLINLNSNFISCIVTNSTISGTLGYGESFFGFPLCFIVNSTVGSEEQVTVAPTISLPTFNWNQWVTYAQNNGTYFSNGQDFATYLANYSTLSNGVDTISPPKGAYYINANENSVKLSSTDSAGYPIVYNFTGSSIMVKGGLSSSAPIVQTSPYTDPTNNKYLPALVTGKQGIKLQFSSDSAPVTPTNIDGVIYSEGNIELAGYNANSISINLSGAIWAGKTIDMNNKDTLYTNIQTAINSSIIDNTEGFNLSLTKTQILSWNEIN
jgi:Tfp pilus assembly protein PilX